MELTLSASESGKHSLRWSAAFAMAVLVHGTAAWLLLRSPITSGPVVPVVMFELPGSLDFPLPPREPGPADSHASLPGEALAAKAQGIGNEPPANSVDAVKPPAATKEAANVAGQAAVDTADNDRRPRDLQTPSNPAVTPDSGGGAGPVPVLRPAAIPGNGRFESMAGAPIDTSVGGNRERQFNGRSGTNQFREIFEHKQPNEPKEFKELRELEERLFKRPVSVAALPADRDRHDAPSHRPAPAIGADGAPRRNAIGILVEHPATARETGISPLGQFVAGSQASTVERPGSLGSGVAATNGSAASSSRGLSAGHTNPTQTDIHNQIPHETVASVGGPSINGTALVRPGSGTGTVGGQAKTRIGAVNGTSIRTKSP
jgi:hypothetical protein